MDKYKGYSEEQLKHKLEYFENKLLKADEELAKKQNEIEKLKEPVSNVDLDYKLEYYKLRKIEAENIELKNTIINMCKIMFDSNNSLQTVIKDIEKELKTLSRRR